MKKKMAHRSLTLHRETLRSLTGAELEEAAGASISHAWSCANSGCDSQICYTVYRPHHCSIEICA